MADAQSILIKLEEAIEATLDGRFEEWAEGNHRFRGLNLDKLLSWRERLQREVAAAGGGGITFGSIVPADGG